MIYYKIKQMSRNKLIYFGLCAILSGFIIGIASEIRFDFYIWLILICLMLLIILQKSRWMILCPLLLGIWLGSYYFYTQKSKIVFYTKEEQDLCLRVEKPNWESEYDLNIASICNKSEKIVFLSAKTFKAGNIILTKGQISPIENKHGFDYRMYLASKGVVGELKGQKIPDPYRFEPNLFNHIENFRKQIIEKTYAVFDKEEADLASGLVLGYRANFSSSFEEAMQATGTTHIVAISGYNVAIVVVIIFTLCLRFGLIWAFFTTVISIIGFVVLTGGEPSVVRASIMALLILGAKVLGRRVLSGYILLLSASVILLTNPFLLKYNPGFILSFAGVFGLVYLAPIVQEIKIFQKLPSVLKETIVATLSAQIAVFPFLMDYFGKISLISLGSNILILPIVPLAMFLSSLAIVAEKIAVINLIFASGAKLVLDWIIWVIEKFASFKIYFELDWDGLYTALFYLGLIMLLWFKQRRRSEKIRK